MSSQPPGADPAERQEQPDPLRSLRHDLRTPVNHIMGYSELLQEEADEQGHVEISASLQRLHQLGKLLLGLINDGLDSARVADDPGSLRALRDALRDPIDTILQELTRLGIESAAAGLQEMAADLRKIRSASERLLALSDELYTEPAPAAPTAAQDVPTATTPQQLASPTGGTILVVDDNAVNRMMLSRRLEREGHVVAVALNGRQALELARSQPFDMVLLDIMMPELDGYAVLEALKADPTLCHIPVLMISALTELESIVRCIEHGAEDYLTKPFDPVLLRARINVCLEKKRLRDQEMLYLQQVELLTAAAAAVEQGRFDPSFLDETAGRDDALGGLARVFQVMAVEVFRREARLLQELAELRGEVDPGRISAQVAEITDSDYFQELQRTVQAMRKRQPPPSS